MDPTWNAACLNAVRISGNMPRIFQVISSGAYQDDPRYPLISSQRRASFGLRIRNR